MRLSATLSGYLARQFLLWFFSFLVVLVAVIMLFDFIELIRRAANRPQVTVWLTAQMTLMKAPELLQDIFHLIVLFSAMFTFWRLTRSQELVIARAAGVSVWQFSLPIVAAAALVGVANVTVFNPIGAAMFAKFEEMEDRLLRGRTSVLKISGSGLWLRQRNETGVSVIFANSADPSSITLREVTVFLYDAGNTYHGRVDGATASLRPGYWDILDASVSIGDTIAETVPQYRLDTDLTAEKIQESFASPETLSFWDLPGFIATLEATGFSARNHRMHFYRLVAQPLLLAAMIPFAGAFALRQTRRGGTALLIVAGVLTGFVIFILNDVVIALGLTDALPPPVAALAPGTVALLIGAATLFHLEDG